MTQRILFADDLPQTRLLLASYLRRVLPGVEVIPATDGGDAVRLVEECRPDLVLLDLRMPEMDGWKAARRIRSLDAGRDVPIIALSFNATEGAEAHAIRAGCDEFVAKPISDYGPLLDRIRYWLARRSPRATADQSARARSTSL